MHIFHKWTKWKVDKSQYTEEPFTFYDELGYAYKDIRRFYRIHESRMCETCGRLEYRIRTSS